MVLLVFSLDKPNFELVPMPELSMHLWEQYFLFAGLLHTPLVVVLVLTVDVSEADHQLALLPLKLAILVYFGRNCIKTAS
jgi:cytochrome c oxidase subunit IV